MSKQQIQKLTEGYSHNSVTKKYERVAAYIRVSTQEQKLHGISLDAQRDKLKEYAKKNNLTIVGWYEDEGVSGRKLIKNRPALQRMLHDAKAKKFDRIIFIKLDRFFRSVAEYHECMKYIDPVLWTATEEKYDLTTANGRAFVNMKLTIAELEADQTGERIDLVNEYKIKTGQAITGSQSQPYGYKVAVIDGVKRVVKDPEAAPVLEDYINHFLTHQNKRQALMYVKKKYGVTVTYNTLTKSITNTLLFGSYRGNDDYIQEPYVDMETFLKIQNILKSNIKETHTKRVFLFSGLLKCPICNCALCGKYDGGIKTNKRPSGKVYTYFREYYVYRCNHPYKDETCTFRKNINETKIEKFLLDNMDKNINSYISEAAVNDDRASVDNELIDKQIKDIKLEMKNTTTAFRKNRMTEKDYDREYEELEAQLKELESHLAPVEERDLTVYEDLLKSDWRDLYNALTKENKRAFWRKYIKRIEFNLDGTIKQPIFF